MEGVDDVAFLAASEARASVLTALHEQGGQTKDDLVEHSGAARVTVARNLDRLAERGLVTAEGRTWHLTPLGDLLVAGFRDMLTTTRAAAEVAPLLERLPPSALDLDPAALAGASVTESSATDPYAPVQRLVERLRAAERARLLLPVFSERHLAKLVPRITAGELTLELVVSPAVAETLRTDAAELVGWLARRDGFTALESEGPLPFYVGLVDGMVHVGVADEGGVPRALAESDDQRVREWAEDRYEQVRETASPLRTDASDTPGA